MLVRRRLARHFVTELRKNYLLFSLLIVSFAVFALDKIAQDNFLYWTYWWYDIMMHFLGGFLVAGIALWLFMRFSGADRRSARYALWVAVLTGIAVGLGWEYFEYFSGALLEQKGNIIGDTALDLVMDTLGACTVWAIIVKIYFTHDTPNELLS